MGTTIINGFGQRKISSLTGGKAFVYRNPEYITREFAKILVVTNVRNKDKKWENRFLKDFSQNGIKVVGELDLLPPIKEYSEDEVKRICDKNEIDGIFTVVLTDRDISSYTTYGYAFSQSTVWGFSIPNTQQKVFAELTLFDVRLGQNAAVIYGNSRYGGIYDSTDRLLRRFTRMAVNQLRPEGVLE